MGGVIQDLVGGKGQFLESRSIGILKTYFGRLAKRVRHLSFYRTTQIKSSFKGNAPQAVDTGALLFSH